MEKGRGSSKQTRAYRIASIAVLTAITTVFTMIIRIPVMPTRGYINLGDVAIFFTALTFGPFTALAAGGLGTALADILGGYAQWAPITFFAHGVQGLMIGLVFKLVKKESPVQFGFSLFFSFLVGTFIMAGTYFLAGGLIYGFGAAATEVPGNIIQNTAGVLLGAPLYMAVRKAYPPVDGLSW